MGTEEVALGFGSSFLSTLPALVFLILLPLCFPLSSLISRTLRVAGPLYQGRSRPGFGSLFLIFFWLRTSCLRYPAL